MLLDPVIPMGSQVMVACEIRGRCQDGWVMMMRINLDMGSIVACFTWMDVHGEDTGGKKKHLTPMMREPRVLGRKG